MASDNRSITTKDHKVSIVFNNSKESEIRNEVNIIPPAAQESGGESEHIEEYAKIFDELDELIGLDKVKELVFQIYAMLTINQHRKNEGMLVNEQVYHMIFKGNPGTGKTSVARILAKLFKTMGLLSKGHLLEVHRADLVGEYIGHTAQKTREVVKKALGGVLFIDEAYSLARGGEKDFGKECIDCLVKLMEDHKNEFILIIAGYRNELDEMLLTNSGLPSRFSIHLDFPDFSNDELLKIAYKMALEREYVILPEAVVKIKELITKEKEDNYNFSNGRFIRNLIEKAIRNQAVRLIKYNKGKLSQANLRNLTYDDFANKDDDTERINIPSFI
ncbi:AAA family ATPase [Paenibacillus sp. S-12]|uniref:AAA family ATPase n=1 Tax=Paenibacillus sp. S-12 TaxID=3031371 RepID=UPI00259FFFF5|nr:AAA family ATPase [Paenibacillus sp. S-12]